MPEEGQQPAGTGEQQQPAAPPWGDDFDPEKAWKLIEGLRADKEKLASRPVLDDDAKRKLDEYDGLIEASKTDLERKTEEVTRWQTEAEKWRTASVASRIEALAAPDFADPSDAASNLDPAKYLRAGGEIDQKAIQADLADLLERKPHYRRAGTADTNTPRVPAPNRAQGAGGQSSPANPRDEFASLIADRLRA